MTSPETLSEQIAKAIAHMTAHLLGYAQGRESPPHEVISDEAYSSPDAALTTMALAACTHYQQVGSNDWDTVTVEPGTCCFIIDGIFSEKWTEWYVNGGSQPVETDHSWWGNGYWDPELCWYSGSGTTEIEGNVYDGNWNWEEFHGWTVTVDNTPPTVPSLLSPANGTETNDCTVALDWTNSTDSGTGVNKYHVQVDNGSSFGSPEFEAYPTSSNDTTTCLGDSYYYWRVQAEDNSGNWERVVQYAYFSRGSQRSQCTIAKFTRRWQHDFRPDSDLSMERGFRSRGIWSRLLSDQSVRLGCQLGRHRRHDNGY